MWHLPAVTPGHFHHASEPVTPALCTGKAEVNSEIESVIHPVPEIGQAVNGNHTLDLAPLGVALEVYIADV